MFSIRNSFEASSPAGFCCIAVLLLQTVAAYFVYNNEMFVASN